MQPNLLARQLKLRQNLRIFILIILVFSFCSSSVLSQTTPGPGIQPLLRPVNQPLHTLIPASIHPLILPREIEVFLKKLESTPPDWTHLRHHDLAVQSERLLQFNRQRDTARMRSQLIQQPIAFVWSGLIRQYLPKFNGFSVALGPEYIRTSWGLIRFKPQEIPDYLVAVPPKDLREELLSRQEHGENIEIKVICIGSLISNESLIYAFSHDDPQDGMILPVVSIESLMYMLKDP